MRPVDRRPLARDLDLLAEHLKRVYNLSVLAVHPPAFRPRLPCDISGASLLKTIIVMLNDPIPLDSLHSPPPYLDYYEIEYIVGHPDQIMKSNGLEI